GGLGANRMPSEILPHLIDGPSVPTAGGRLHLLDFEHDIALQGTGIERPLKQTLERLDEIVCRMRRCGELVADIDDMAALQKLIGLRPMLCAHPVEEGPAATLCGGVQ